jgi:hypothetical protein
MRLRANGSALHRAPRSASNAKARALDALAALDAGMKREPWVRIAMAAKAAGLDLGDFTEWSRPAPNFRSEADCAAVWRSIQPGKVGAGTLFAMARDAGWRDGTNSGAANGRPGPSVRRQGPQTRPSGGTVHGLDYRRLWADSEAATPAHPYIDRKLGLADGLRVYRGPASAAGQALDGALLVPAFNAAGELQSWQAIPKGEGAKLNAPRASMTGGRFIVGGPLADGAPVFLCEGIGAAWSAHRATGAPAVCCFGAGNIERIGAELRERHPGAALVIVADVGKELDAERIARKVAGRFVTMPAGWPANADVNDMHQREGLAAVAELLAQAREPARRFRLLTAEELAALPPLRWRIRDVLPAEGIAAIYGEAASGKTFLTLDALAAVSEGRPWFGHRTEPSPATYLALEGEAGISQRVAAFVARHGRAPAQMRLIAQPFAMLEPGDVAELADAIRAAGAAGGIVAVDTLARAAPGADENAPDDMGRIVASAQALRAAVGGLVLLVHHMGKTPGRGPRGHSSLFAALDAGIEVARDDAGRRWTCAKAKDAADGHGYPFALDVVHLGTDDAGQPITSCVVTDDVPALERRAKVPGGGNMRACWDVLGQALREAGPGRPEGAPVELPMGRPAITLEAAIEAAAPRLVCESRRKRERAMEAIRALVGRGLLQHLEGWIWCA